MTTAGAVLETVNNAVSEYQIQRPAFYGDLTKTMASVGVGAGCITNLERFKNMGCDIAVVCVFVMIDRQFINAAVDYNVFARN